MDPSELYDSQCSSCRTECKSRVSFLRSLDGVETGILILLVGLVGQVYWCYLILTLVILLCILHPVMSDSDRAYPTQPEPSSSSSSPKMTPQKRKAEFDEDVASTSEMRRISILETTAREQSKRKWDDSIDSLCERFSKRLRCQPQKQASIKTNRSRKASRQKLVVDARLSRIKRYRDRWIPFKPPWITSRILKQYVSAEGWRKRRVFCPCPAIYVEGLELFCANVSSEKRNERARSRNRAHQPSMEEEEENL